MAIYLLFQSRQQLHQQLRMSRDLTMKINKEDSSEGEDIEEDHPVYEDNPWMKGTNEYEEFSNKYRKYWEEENAKKAKSKENAKASESREEVEEIESVTSVKDGNKSHTSMIIKEPVEAPLKFGLTVTEIAEKSIDNEKKRTINDHWECTSFGISSKQNKVKFNGATYNGVTCNGAIYNGTKCNGVIYNGAKCNGVIYNGTKCNGAIYNGAKCNGFKDVDDMFEHMENIMKKKFEKKASELKGGQAANQQRKFMKEMHDKKESEAVNVSESQVKEDPSQGAINLETTTDEKSKWNVTAIKYVNELPYPYVAVESFESSIRAPLGSMWVPETAHRKFIAPKIKTLIGTVIEPLSEEALIDNSESLKDFDEKEVVCEVY
ncbi:hypothetical protein J437_LFUL011333 [Ladona fulva]|uniref:Uncharacterized protein n=1 Tax=Ladona fulva TaxID=123851 RepID=A0A8K0P368_LADFU|nr:hypothetical protein J437_LFUL011333 [Ladona fulva]